MIDPRTVKPLDFDLIRQSVQKTGRLVVADGGWMTGGIAAEIAARAAAELFYDLRAPVLRVALPDVPAPASRTLEEVYYPRSKDIEAAVRKVLVQKQTQSIPSFRSADEVFNISSN